MSRNKYPEETVSRILDVSFRLFMEKGYENTSIQDIIDGLGGLTKGAIYHHFKSKEDIMLAAMDRVYRDHDITWPDIMTSKPGVTGLDKLRAMFRASIENPAHMEVFSTAINMLKNPKMLTMQIQSIYQESAPNYILPVIQEGIADGSIKTDYPLQLAEVILLLINLWLTPMVYCADVETMRNRFGFYQQMLHSLGIDLLDDELLLRFEEFCRLYNTKIS